MLQPIKENLSLELLQANLNGYIKLALEAGAKAALAVSTKEVFLDPRANLKCRFPRCDNYGVNANCPPYTLTASEMEAYLRLYHYGILFRCDYPPTILKGATPKDRQLPYRIISGLEQAAFYDGYYFATGFGAGPCKRAWCPNEPCQALEPGKPCRFPDKARASMEAVGFDVYRTAAHFGWDIYPVGRKCKEEDVPKVVRVGLVLIA